MDRVTRATCNRPPAGRRLSAAQLRNTWFGLEDQAAVEVRDRVVGTERRGDGGSPAEPLDESVAEHREPVDGADQIPALQPGAEDLGIEDMRGIAVEPGEALQQGEGVLQVPLVGVIEDESHAEGAVNGGGDIRDPADELPHLVIALAHREGCRQIGLEGGVRPVRVADHGEEAQGGVAEVLAPGIAAELNSEVLVLRQLADLILVERNSVSRATRFDSLAW